MRCGLFYSLDVPFLLDGMHVSVRIVDLIAEVQILQFFVNNSDRISDGEYVFPLDEGASVCAFEVELADKLLIGEVREKQEARQVFLFERM